MKSRLLGMFGACAITLVSLSAQAIGVSGQGTWETTLLGRDLDGNTATFEAYYDTTLDITWLADANINGRDTKDNQDAWAVSLTIGGVSGWRLPTVSPIDGSTFDVTFSNNASTDSGMAPTTTDGTDGGWRDGGNTPVSEMGHMYYVTLGNLGLCTPDNGNPSGCTEQTGWGLTNTGPFSNVVSGIYWSGTEAFGRDPGFFVFESGSQAAGLRDDNRFAWAVRDGDVVPASAIVSAVLPTSRSVQVGAAASAFATIINTDTDMEATGCSIAPLTSVPAGFSYQTTDSATNALTGTPDTPADIPAGGNQSYVFALTPTASFSPVDVHLIFDCTNTDPAPVTVGLNTLLLVVDSNPVPDIVALSATLTGDGIVNLANTGVFAVATVNVGNSGTITASADTGGTSLPVSIALCETDPATSVCINPTVPTLEPVTTSIAADATPTFAFFVTGTDTVLFDPANNRIFVRFQDAGGVTRGATSVAVRTLFCDRDKPNQYAPECVCPEQFREFAITGRLPTDLAEGSAVSVYPQGGAEYVICMPPFPSWNGGMVYASTGTVKLAPNEEEGTIVTVAGQLDNDGVPLSSLFNQAGYGFAVVAPPQLLSVPSREADLELLVDLVEMTLGEPTFSYVVGFSQGAIPATRLLERGAESPFSGGISACGPIGSFGIPGQIQPSEPPLVFTQAEYSFQFLVIVDYLFPELKLLRDILPPFVEVPRVPAITLATWDDDAVEAVFGDSFNAGKVVQLLEVMDELGLPVAVDPPNVPVEETLAELVEEVTFFVNDSVSDLGGSIFDNWATEYPDPELNAGVKRYSSTIDDDAVSPYETSGLHLPDDPPLVALHNFLDHRVPYDHVLLYALKSDAAAPFIKFPIPLGGIPRYGHCDFTAEEAALAFQCLIVVVEAGLPSWLVCPPPTPGIP